ncbi:MAG TPA: amidohydrolase family protein [Candidatus Hydrogenedentes bacterium]|nr:amidohydrolase family protein [Candidatus Hydrogenedentota bacterium]
MQNFVICDATIGLPRLRAGGIEPTVADLLSEMGRLRVRKAIVRHRLCLDVGPYHGNQALMEEIEGQPDLLAAWAVTPDGRPPDFSPVSLVKAMLDDGVKAAWLAPKAHGFPPQPWCAGALYGALEEAAMPLLVAHDDLTGDDIDAIGRAFPRLRLILLECPRLGRNRNLYPLLERHENLFLCVAPPFSVHCGLRDLCRRFGAHRWVLGSGYPEAEGGAAIAGLMYAGLSDEDAAAIAHGNIERLLEEVRHDDR